MIKYECGHTTKGVIIMDSNPLSMATYLMWAEDEGNLKSQKECFDCFLKTLESNRSI